VLGDKNCRWNAREIGREDVKGIDVAWGRYRCRDLVNAILKLVRFEVFTAVTMKSAVFWDRTTQFVPHRRHITSPLQSPAS
jgi:hypothetical protein